MKIHYELCYLCGMIQYSKVDFPNGLKLLIHEDKSTPMVAVNILYGVGSKDESSSKTGFAHLFEHLMFSGSANVADFDVPIQMAGGENNAFTNSDMTNFYNVVPKENLETVLWVESDRMSQLNVDQTNLDIQKKVVVEEFKETCLNQPYGDMWHRMSEVVYRSHSYNWPTIGKEISHIEKASLTDVRGFYERFYQPSNAIISVVGDVSREEIIELISRYFPTEGAPDTSIKGTIPTEPAQSDYRKKIVEADVPAEALYLGFRMCERNHEDYYKADLLSDILANGRSSRFHANLYKGTDYFTTIDAYISGTIDPGLLMIEAKINEERDTDVAYAKIWDELEQLKEEEISDMVLQKLINKIEAAQVYSELSPLNKAINLCYYTYIGDTELINNQISAYSEITAADLRAYAQKLFTKENCTEIRYIKKK